MIRLFVAWLDLLSVPEDTRNYRVMIHDTADSADAVGYWADVVGVDSSRFQRTTVKRHQPRTKRVNVGNSYHGCLTITVRMSSSLYRCIEGWWRGLVVGIDRLDGTRWSPRSPFGSFSDAARGGYVRRTSS